MARVENRTRLPAELRRKQIALAARHVFAVQGLAGAKTRQIAEAAEVTETILYRHFSSKEEIFDAAILEPVEQLATDLMRLTAEFPRVDPQRRLEMSQQVHDEIRRVVQEITPLLGVALFSSREAGRDFYRQRLVPLFDLAADAISQAMAPRQQTVVEPRVLLLCIVGMYFGMALDDLFSDRIVDWDIVTGELTKLVAFGALAPSPPLLEKAAGRRRR